jgi:hypothetical protein
MGISHVKFAWAAALFRLEHAQYLCEWRIIDGLRETDRDPSI